MDVQFRVRVADEFELDSLISIIDSHVLDKGSDIEDYPNGAFVGYMDFNELRAANNDPRNIVLVAEGQGIIGTVVAYDLEWLKENSSWLDPRFVPEEILQFADEDQLRVLLVSRFATRKDMCRNGIGTEVLKSLIEHSNRNGFDLIVSLILEESSEQVSESILRNSSSIRVHESVGFIRVGEHVNDLGLFGVYVFQVIRKKVADSVRLETIKKPKQKVAKLEIPRQKEKQKKEAIPM